MNQRTYHQNLYQTDQKLTAFKLHTLIIMTKSVLHRRLPSSQHENSRNDAREYHGGDLDTSISLHSLYATAALDASSRSTMSPTGERRTQSARLDIVAILDEAIAIAELSILRESERQGSQ